MDKLAQIVIDNSFNVVVSCQVDQKILAKNFATILNALKELQQGQFKNQSQILELNSLKDKFKVFSDKIEKLQLVNQSSGKLANSGLSKQNNDQSVSNNSQGLLNAITKRLDKDQSSILENIKDINILNKDVADVKKQIANLKNTLSNFGSKQTNNNDQNLSINKELQNNFNSNLNEKGGYGIQQIAQNMSKQLNKNSEQMKDLSGRLSAAQNHIIKLKDELDKMLRNSKSQNLGEPQQSNNKDGKYQQMNQEFKDKIDAMNQKIKNIKLETDHNNQQISDIKDILAQTQNQNNQIKGEGEDQIFSNSTIKSDIAQLKKSIEEVNSRESKDVKKINEDIANLKLAIKGGKTQKGQNNEGIQSYTSIDEQADNSNGRMSQKQIYDRINEKLNNLVMKVNYLQKIISNSSKKLIGSDQKTTGGFPVISRHKKRADPNATGLQQKNGIGRKDLAQLKADLEVWIKSLLDKGNQQQNIQDFYLRIQEIKHSLQKKADADGTKKGLAFLQGKITQLFLFLTEPETQDAMIARKGFNCLSCSKKVEKLRGKLGPRLNWNNMTSTNYSPPRVGYSRPMGEQTSKQKQDDL